MTIRSLLMAASGRRVKPSTAVVVSSNGSPFIHAYHWNMKYGGLMSKLPNPSSLPVSFVKEARFTNSGDFIVAGVNNSVSGMVCWRFSTATGFGAMQTAADLESSSAVEGVAVSSRDDAVFAAHEGKITNRKSAITAWRFGPTGFGSKYEHHVALMNTIYAMTGVDFNKAQSAVVGSTTSSPYIAAVEWSSSTGFGVAYSSPATLPPANGHRKVRFSPKNGVVAITNASSPYITAYRFGQGGFGLKYSDPSSLPTGAGQDVAFSPDESAIVVTHQTSPFVTAYKWSSSGFGVKLSNPSSLPGGTGGGVKFSSDGKGLIVAGAGTVPIAVYEWNKDTGFGVRLSTSVAMPANGCNSIDFN